MFLRQIDLTTALRPSLHSDETLLFVQDAVGLYEGKFKLPDYQNGQAYLTTHRACYVDHNEPRKYCVGIDLKDVERAELYAGFLKSSPKITLHPRPSKRSSLSIRTPYSPRISGNSTPVRIGSPARLTPAAPSIPSSATWICPICSFSNPVPSNFDPATVNSHTQLPPCLACGIKPALNVVVKASLAAMANRQPEAIAEPGTFRCPRCTFENHPSLLNCEICGQSLVSADNKRLEVDQTGRSESPGPSLERLNLNEEVVESVKFSFRDGGEKVFHERLKNALIQRKWLLQSAPPIPKPVSASGNGTAGHGLSSTNTQQKLVGIAGLERRGQDLRKNNETLIGSAFEDLEALMTSAKEIIALAEQFSSQANGDKPGSELLAQSASALGFTTTKDMLKSDSLYVSELSRNLAEFLTDDNKGVLKNEGGIMSLVDLWAVFNRARGGVELVSPADFGKAAEMWETLKLPVRLRRFRSGLLVVQSRDWTDEKTIAALSAWLKDLHEIPPADFDATKWDWRNFGRGVTAQETAERFGWSVGVATEELEMAEDKGVLCREVGLDGLRFWENWIPRL